MKKITKSVIDRLSEVQGSPVLSIYMPTHRLPGAQHVQEDQTRFKNLIREAELELERNDADSMALKANLTSLEELVDNQVFWQQTLEGLAIFIDDMDAQMYSAPMEFEESVTYRDSFDLAPLHIVNSQNRKFYVLSLAMQGSRIFKGDAYGLTELDIELPSSMEDALNIDELHANNKMRRSHRGGPSGITGTTTPHGEGDTAEAGEHERLQYFKIIEQKLVNSSEFDSNKPLLLSATDSEAAHFRSTTSLTNILDSTLHGSHGEMAAGELFSAAWPIIKKEVIGREEKGVVEQYNEHKGVFRASADISDIASAAEEGRVDTLMVNYLDNTNDSITDYQNGPSPVVRTTAESSKEKLKNLIDLVYGQGGKIIGLDLSEMPDNLPVAASYRY